MTELQHDSPLKWPMHILPTERLKRGINHQFQQGMSESDAIAYLQDEVTQTAAISSAKLTCNAMQLNSTMPTKYLSKNLGASVILRIDNQQAILCCDKWQSLAHNIYALHLAVRQFRQISDWGVGSLPVLLHGFSENAAGASAASAGAPTPPSANGVNWQKTLGLGANATLEDANAVYRARAKAIGENDPDALQDLNLAIQEARRQFSAE